MIDGAEEKSRKSVLSIIAGKLAPKVTSAAGAGIASALGMGGPIGGAIGGGLWLVARAIRRRRRKDDV